MKSKLLVFFLLAISSFAFAAPNATDLIVKADHLLRGEKSSRQLIGFYVYRPGKKVVREMVGYSFGTKYSFNHIIEPVRDKDTTLLKRDYDLWMYTPKVKKTIRIPFAMMHQGFMGSDFTYDDIAREATWGYDYNHTLVGLSKSYSKRYKSKVWVVDLTPKPGKPIAYKKLRIWVIGKGTIAIRVQYYDDNLKVVRMMELSNIRKVHNRVIPTKWKMTDLRKQKHYTIMYIKNAVFDDLKDDSMFNIRSLDNPPVPPKGLKKVKKEKEEIIDASDMVRKADLLLRGEKSSNQYVDFIVVRPGKKVAREMISYSLGKKYSLTHITKPLRDRDTTTLKRDYDIWMYTPKVKKTIRIPFAMMHQGFMGSDFTYDDIAREATWSDDYSHKIVGISKDMSKKYKSKVYVLELLPLPGRPVAYKKLRLWIKKDGYIPLKIFYYNDDLKVVRMMELSKIKKVDDRIIPTVWRMMDLTKKGHFTYFIIKNAVFNKISDENMFSQRALQSPPSPIWEK